MGSIELHREMMVSIGTIDKQNACARINSTLKEKAGGIKLPTLREFTVI